MFGWNDVFMFGPLFAPQVAYRLKKLSTLVALLRFYFDSVEE